MHHEISLNGPWSLSYAEGRSRTVPFYLEQPHAEPEWSVTAQVPEAVQQTLVREGVLPSPYEGTGTLSARWVEDVYWVYRRRFTLTDEQCASRNVVLRCDGIDLSAKVFVNGAEVASVMNANMPHFISIADAVTPGENVIIVRLTTGWQEVVDRESGYAASTLRSNVRRQWLRRPQYTSGWDWNPQLTNVGIVGDVSILCFDAPMIVQTAINALPDSSLQSAEVRVRCHAIGEAQNGLALQVSVSRKGDDDTIAAVEREVTAGELEREENHGVSWFAAEATLTLERPNLWWPRGKGEQHCYTASVAIANDGREISRATATFGVRSVELDQSAHPEGGSFFTLKVNGVPVFCKGGNWVPPDLFYAGVSDSRLDTLVEEAAAADFTMLRVWGGGCWVPDRVLARCDELGIMVWHDYLFACVDYPGSDDEFLRSVVAESRWGTRAMVSHPSLVVISGNNEVRQNDENRGGEGEDFTILFLDALKSLAGDEAPAAFYWPASPHSPRGLHPNDPTVGDQHPWGVSLGGYASCPVEGPQTNFFSYRTHYDRFANEGGVLGTSTLPTLRRYLGQEGLKLGSLAWRHHDNFHGGMNPKNPGGVGTAPQMVTDFLGGDPRDRTIEEYVNASMLLQAEGLEEYIRTYRRRMFDSSAAIFWMYNDSWPTSHSWTTHDYDLRRKLSYYAAKRAFAPVSVVVVEEDERIKIYGINDRLEPVVATLEFGVVPPEAREPRTETTTVELAPNASTFLKTLPLPDDKRDVPFARLTGSAFPPAQHSLFRLPYKKLGLGTPALTLERAGNEVLITSDRLAWGVCLDVEGEMPLEENCVTVVPGLPYPIGWKDEFGKPRVVAVGNELVRQ